MGPLNDGGPVSFFPIRHHSPACSVQLIKALNIIKPDIVLIEGPSDSNEVIEHIANPLNKAPFAIYYTFKGKGSENKSACYYPLLDFSPELAAIRWAKSEDRPARFIDMPYALSKDQMAKEEGKREAYYSDYELFHSRYTELLCEKEGVRGPGELWEKLFELGGHLSPLDQFVGGVLAWCRYSRYAYTDEMLNEEGTIGREEWMAEEIQKAIGEGYKNILCVTGGFHAEALQSLVNSGFRLKKAQAPQGSSAYLIAYSFAEADQLSGYASGIPYPTFSQKAFEAMGKGSPKPYTEAMLRVVSETAGKLRKLKNAITLSDEAAAYIEAIGLAELRGKKEPGAWEALDSIISSFVKGAMDREGAIAVQTAKGVMQGDGIGSIGSGAALVPLLSDFLEKAEAHRLKVKTATAQEAVLDILSSKPHKAASAFLHRMEFLDSGFCAMQSGPNYAKRDASRVRETWKYALNASVESKVIEKSYLGGTVREAASCLALDMAGKAESCESLTSLLVDCAVMALNEHMGPLIEKIYEAAAEDGSFESLVKGLQNLSFLSSSKALFGFTELDSKGPIDAIAAKASSLIPSLAAQGEREDYQTGKALRDLYEAFMSLGLDRPMFIEGLMEALRLERRPPAIEGAICGLLYALGEIAEDECLRRASSYFYGDLSQMKKSGRFLSGLFLTAQDIIFDAKGSFLRGMDNVFSNLGEEEFLTALPDIRLAMSEFSPYQIDRASKAVGGFYGVGGEGLDQPASPDALFGLGRQLDLFSQERVEEWIESKF